MSAAAILLLRCRCASKHVRRLASNPFEDLPRADETADPPEALNGLQVSNSGDVTRIAAAVDLCAATVRMASEQRADLLLVHHGLFWGGLRPLVGPAYGRIAAIQGTWRCSRPRPLDRHPNVGNNRELARMLGISVRGEFGSYHGAPIGVWGEHSGTRDELSRALAKVLGATPRLLPFGPERVHRVGIVTGAGGGLIAQAAAAGLDTYITGEGQHWTFFDARSCMSTCSTPVITRPRPSG